MVRIGVLGAGIIGISSAVAIQKSCPNAEITIISETFTPNTTSDLAAGFIEPYLCEDDPKRINKWTKLTIDRIKEYINEGNEGAGEISGYWMKKEREIPEWISIMNNVRILNDDELKQVARRPDHRFGIFFTTWYLEPVKYIPYCTEIFVKNDGKIRKSKIKAIEDISDEFDILVNCTGLGSRHLFNDTSIRPMRGQIMRVSCPSLKYFLIDETYYALLNDNSVILGGTAEIDKWETDVDETVAKRIFEENCTNVPNLKSAKILSNHVGLRPYRPTVRLETEQITLENGMNIPLVHNYGHSGSGITIHWGCALETADRVYRLIQKSHL